MREKQHKKHPAGRASFIAYFDEKALLAGAKEVDDNLN